jgi:hypothetical protein
MAFKGIIGITDAKEHQKEHNKRGKMKQVT